MSKHTELPRMRVRKRSRGAEPAKAAKGAYIYLYCILCIDGGYIYICTHTYMHIDFLFPPFLSFSLFYISDGISIYYRKGSWSDRNPAAGRMFPAVFFFLCVSLMCICRSMCLGLGCVSNPTESSRLEFLFIECTPTFQLAKLGRAPLAPPLQCRTLSL